MTQSCRALGSSRVASCCRTTALFLYMGMHWYSKKLNTFYFVKEIKKMKKTIALFALVLSILAGLVSGSLALYSKSVDLGTPGSVVAKKFTMTAAKSTGFTADVPIAPTEVVTAAFTVSNFEDSYITETGMDLDIKVTLADATDKTAIPYISADLLDVDDNVIGSAVNTVANGEGTITLAVNHAFVANTAATKTYKLRLTWVSQGLTDTDNDGISNDAEYQGPDFGTAYTVVVTGVQDID